MKSVIRKNVFETNSSSCHSISISDSDTLNNIPTPDVNGNISIYPLNFGWERDIHDDFGSKASYVAIYCRNWSKGKEKEWFKILEDVIKEVTLCKEVVYEGNMMEFEMRSYEHNGETIEYKYFGYDKGSIDHQSVEDRDLDFLFEDPKELKRFLFSNDSVLYTDNDNH